MIENDNNDIPWLNSSMPQNNILMNTIANSKKVANTSSVPSMESLARERARESGNYVEEAQQQRGQSPYGQNPQIQNDTLSAIINELKNIGIKIDNAVDVKYLTQGTVFLVLIDKNVKTDINSRTIPTHLVESPISDVKIVSYQDYENQTKLKEILMQYYKLVDTFKQGNPNAKSGYFVFIGRLIESVNFNAFEYKI